MAESTDRRREDKPTLRVYIAPHCPICREALRIVESIRRRFAKLYVEVIDLEAKHAKNIDGVFSVPTYVLNGRTVSLGNPELEALERKLTNAMSTVKGERE